MTAFVIVTTDPRGVTFDGERFELAGTEQQRRDRAMRFMGAMCGLYPSYTFEVWQESDAPVGQPRQRFKIA